MYTLKRLKLFWLLTGAFIIAVVAGTLAHECGHYLAARTLGYQARISYAYTSWDGEHTENAMAATDGSPEAVKQEKDNIIITALGPAQTLLTGTLGLALLLLFRQRIRREQELKFYQWIMIFLTLNWLRQPFNFMLRLSEKYLLGFKQFNDDESAISLYLGLPTFSILSVTAILALGITCLAAFYFVPQQQRRIFILACLCGTSIGYYLWFILLGPRWMPFNG